MEDVQITKLTPEEKVSRFPLSPSQNYFEKFQNVYSIIKTIEFLVRFSPLSRSRASHRSRLGVGIHAWRRESDRLRPRVPHADSPVLDEHPKHSQLPGSLRFHERKRLAFLLCFRTSTFLTVRALSSDLRRVVRVTREKTLIATW